MNNIHSFHVPVLGIAYTIDSPIKRAPYGIDSVISIADHRLAEHIRKYYCEMYNLPYEEIKENEHDSRAKKINAYLNLVNDIVNRKFEELKNSEFSENTEITKYFEMLPENSLLKKEYNEMLEMTDDVKVEKQNELREKIKKGSIDVNIMTKLDKINYSSNNEELPTEFNDAHAALRGYATSNLSNSSVVLSAGLNPKLYSYMTNFKDFYPDENGNFKKKIILKVSDYRSALIQGKFLAKKGLWISEYRIESGLNCGGHAFAGNGYLIGPILEEFKENRADLLKNNFEMFSDALKAKNIIVEKIPELRITVQGGVSTNLEHNFLIERYNVNSVGWGTPFLLVPEAINIDKDTMDLLAKAEEKDLYLSKASPLGVHFNNVRNNTADKERLQFIEEGHPGVPCIKQHLCFNTEFTEKAVCTASRVYQNFKIKELKEKNLSESEYQKELNTILEKTCICVGLTNPAIINYNIESGIKSKAVSVCPGPSMANFSKIVSLKEMVDHIYGKIDVIKKKDYPNMFTKELKMYIDFFKEKIEEAKPIIKKQASTLESFKSNLSKGIEYYKELSSDFSKICDKFKTSFINELELLENELNNIEILEA